MQTRSNITKSVRNLMRTSGLTDMSAMADHLGVAPEYMPQKMRDDRWTLDDIDTLGEVFGVSTAAIVSGTGSSVVRWQASEDPTQKVYEVTMTLDDGDTRTCLAVASSMLDAVNSIVTGWDTEADIRQVTTEEKHYFSINISPLSTNLAADDPAEDNGDISD